MVAALGANSSFLLAFPDADRGAIIRVSYAHPVQIFGVEDVVLVTFVAAGPGLAGRALPLGAGPGVSLWVDYGEVRVAAFFVARGAGGWARDGRMGGLAGSLTGPFEAFDGDTALIVITHTHETEMVPILSCRYPFRAHMFDILQSLSSSFCNRSSMLRH